jgi:hypothetical protein
MKTQLANQATEHPQAPKARDSVDGLFAEALRDAEEWGGALNAASWEMMNAYRAHMGEVESVKFFNMSETMLRQCILRFLAQIATNVGANTKATND